MRGNWSGTGRNRIRNVIFTFCKSLLPVTTGTFLGCERMSKMIGLCTHGIKKCVPSPTTPCLIPWKRSKITARWPPSTRSRRKKSNPNEKSVSFDPGGYFTYHYIMPNWRRRQPMLDPSPIVRSGWIIVPFLSTWNQIKSHHSRKLARWAMSENAIS